MTELYNVTIGKDDVSGDYLGAIYCKHSDEAGGTRDKNLYKVLNTVARRIKDKEKERRLFPVVSEPSAIVLPNGRVQ